MSVGLNYKIFLTLFRKTLTLKVKKLKIEELSYVRNLENCLKVEWNSIFNFEPIQIHL